MKKLTFLASCTLLLITSSFVSSVIPASVSEVPANNSSKVVLKSKAKGTEIAAVSFLEIEASH